MKKQILIAGGLACATLGLSVAEEKAAEPAKTAAEPKAELKLTEEHKAQIQEAIKQAQLKKAAEAKAENPMTLDEAKVYFSRGAGVNIGSQLKSDTMVNKEEFLQGLNDAIEGKTDPADLDPQKMAQAQQMMQEAQTAAAKKEGEDFLAKNKDAEGVKLTESGLQYKVITAGEGDSPTPADQVKVHYTGKLIDGTVFDSSVERGTPVTFGVTQVIPGWVEGLQLMKPGAKYEFSIPSDLAYGARGQRSIPPHSALLFEVELIEVIKPAPPAEKPVEEKAAAKVEEKKAVTTKPVEVKVVEKAAEVKEAVKEKVEETVKELK